MNIKPAVLTLFIFTTAFMSQVNRTYSAYATLGMIEIFVPPSVAAGEPVQVNATVYTDVAG